MAKINISILVFVTLCGAAGIFAQRKQPGQPVFSSVYSDLAQGKSCRTIEEELIGCNPVGGYRIFAGFHNVLERVWIENRGGQQLFDTPSDKQGGISRNAGKFEWRMANGKPFAIIARFELFSMDDVEANRDLSKDRSKFAQVLVVKGLPGYEQIDFELDARVAGNTNQKARDLADEAYMKNSEKKVVPDDVEPARRLVAEQPNFMADMACVNFQTTSGHGYGEEFKTAKMGDFYRYESKDKVDYFGPDRALRFPFKTKKFEPLTGFGVELQWFETIESSAMLALHQNLKFEIAGKDSVDFEIGGKTEKREVIKVKITGEMRVGDDIAHGTAFLYAMPQLKNLIVKTEMIYPNGGRNCSLRNVSFSVPAALFEQFDDYRKRVKVAHPIPYKADQ